MAASDLSFQRACHVKGDSQRLASLSEGLGVAGDRLKIGGLGVDQTTFGDQRSEIFEATGRSEKRHSETAKRAKPESSFGQLEQQRKSKMEQKAQDENKTD